RVLVFAGSSDKDIAGMFRVLGPLFDEAFLARYAQNPRAVEPQDLARLWATEAGAAPAHVCAGGVREALERARGSAGEGGLVCVTGSVFLAGEARPMLVGE